MKKIKDKRVILLLVLMNLFPNITRAETSEVSFDEYELLEEITTLNPELNIEEEDRKDKRVRSSRMTLDGRSGTIYAIADPVSISPMLDIITREAAYINSMGSLENIDFYIYTNYNKFIKKYEILVYKNEDTYGLNPIIKLPVEDLAMDEPISWEAKEIKQSINLERGDKLVYILRAYDEDGRFDETSPKEVILKSSAEIKIKNIESEEDLKRKIENKSNIAVKGIPVSGSKIRIYGKDITDTKELKINNQMIDLDTKGDFIHEVLTENPSEFYELSFLHLDGVEETYEMEVITPENYSFLVGIADFYLGKNSVSGSDAILKNDPDFQDNFFNTGRLAFYYKKIYNNYRITAQADTWNRQIKDMFSNLNERDPQRIFNKIDRDSITYNYGDESFRYWDVKTEGKMYLSLEWDKSQILWGSYDTGFTGTKFGEYNRSLYGARAEYNSLDTTTFGESINSIKGFASKPDTSYQRDEFLGTGGSVYYLSENDIVVGSAKLILELRNKDTGRVIKRVALTEGRDYQINEISGRIILEEPLTQGSYGLTEQEIIKDSPSGSYNQYLVADYEYYDIDNSVSNHVAGVRGKTWLTDNVGIGGTYVDETRKSGIGDYELKSVDLTFKKSNGTYIMGEYSESKGNQLVKDSNWFSNNGGFEFVEQPIIDINKKGSAYYLEGGISLFDYFQGFSEQDGFNFWYSKKERGFSTASDTSGISKEEYGLRGDYRYSENLKLYTRASVYKETSYVDQYWDSETNGVSEEKEILIGGERRLSDRFKIGLEGQYVDNNEDKSSLITLNSDELDNGKAVLIGTKLTYAISPTTEVFTKLQGNVWRGDEYKTNNLYSVGGKSDLTEKLRLEAEGSTGNRGEAVDVRLLHKYSEDYEVYVGYYLDNTDDRENSITFGQRFDFNDRTKLYQENQFVNRNYENGILQTYGIDYEYSKILNLGLIYQSGDVDTSNGKIKRNSISTLARFNSPKFYSKHKLEFGKDTGSSDRTLWGTTNKFKWLPTNEYTVFGEGNFVIGRGDMGFYEYNDNGDIIDDKNPSDEDSKYYEVGLGLGYRPVWEDRLNLIGKYAYIYDDGSKSLRDNDYSEKAHVISLEGIYDLTRRLSIGGKYAFRKEEVKQYRGEQWFGNTLDLFAVRATYEIIKKWDIYTEYHWLRDHDSNDLKHGALVGVYREVGENLQVGVGYNFTDYTDDLTDLDYKNQGWFINLIGKF